MTRQRTRALDRRTSAFRAALTVVASGGLLLGSSGCYRTRVTSVPTRDFGYDRRTPVDAEAEIVSSQWQAEPGRITGKVELGECRVERMSYQVVTVTTRREPNKIAGYAFLGGGLLMTAVGFALWNASASCPNGGCSGERNSAFLVLGLGTGLPAMGVGVGTLIGKLSVKDEPGERKEDVKNEVGPCVEPRELADLALVLQVEEGKTLPVRLSADGSAVIEVPAGFELPQGVDLPVVVERVPRHTGDILRRSQVVGTVRLDAGAAADP